jgi:translation initiation factor 2-alpha kinase 4
VPQMYPKQPPQLAVMNPKNLSAEHVKTLSKVLQDKAKTLVGEEMIFTVRLGQIAAADRGGSG